MTEYEMAEILIGFTVLLDTNLQYFTTLLFAFLIASYLVSAKLSRLMAFIVIGLFTGIEFNYVVAYWGFAADLVELQQQILTAQQQAGSQLGFLFTKFDDAASLESAFNLNITTMIINYIAALAFFFHVRHHPREV